MKKITLLILLLFAYILTNAENTWTGTGWALKQGYIVTNYHCVDGATKIRVQTSQGMLKAKVVATDEDADLAIIKINDSKYKGFGEVPYSIGRQTCQVAEDVWTIGYPMIELQGEEIKYTDGKISSNTGYKGDTHSYQISVPIQPGNSGGPLFNKDGKVVGITNARLSPLISENVNYAIKSYYLIKLVENKLSTNVLPKGNMSGLSLPEQVKKAKNFVFPLYFESNPLKVNDSESNSTIYLKSKSSLEYITVSCDASYSISDIPSWCYISNKTNTSFTLNYDSNPYTFTRYGSIEIESGNQHITLSLEQAAKSDASATIYKIWADHNVYESSQKGMRLHVKFDAYDVYWHDLNVCAYFYYKDGEALKGVYGSDYITRSGHVTVQEITTAHYTNTTWNDFTLFIPYKYLNMSSDCDDVQLEVQIGINDKSIDEWITPEYEKYYFTYSNVDLRVNGLSYNSTTYLNHNKSAKTITVSSNKTYSIQKIPSWCSITNQTSTSFTLNHSANPNTSKRYGSIEIKSGGKVITLSLEQESAPITIDADKTNISADATGKTEKIVVTSNTSWDFTLPDGDMSSVTRNGNTLTVTISPNPTKRSRSSYFYIKTSDRSKSITINLSQKENQASASIKSIKLDHNVYSNRQKGMTIHVDLTAYEAYQRKVKVCTYFYHENGNAIKGTNGNGYTTTDGTATIQRTETAPYTYTTWQDFALFMPYQYLNLHSQKKEIVTGKVGIYDETTGMWLTNKNKEFQFVYSNTNKGPKTRKLTTYDKYCQHTGTYEITWFGQRFGGGTHAYAATRLFSFRLGPIQFNPLDVAVTHNFKDYKLNVYYTPSIDFLVPMAKKAAWYFGGGPTWNPVTKDIWFNTSTGIRLNLGKSSSYDIFVRYDGDFSAGLSFQWSTYF